MRDKIQVFAIISYDFFQIPNVFGKIISLLGHFQIEQTITESYDKRFRMWFWTDEVEIKEGELRQVDILGTRHADDTVTFEIKKIER